ncbi:MAG: hypothetical protein DRP51_01400 [Candidatus Zixiibacteriota bacterium]|nr:MAG: hypothetical protein DRP51_01400 [candidate division Zixibacteria bacterium]
MAKHYRITCAKMDNSLYINKIRKCSDIKDRNHWRIFFIIEQYSLFIVQYSVNTLVIFWRHLFVLFVTTGYI